MIPTRLQSSGQERALWEEPRVGKLKGGFKTRVSNSDIEESQTTTGFQGSGTQEHKGKLTKQHARGLL